MSCGIIVALPEELTTLTSRKLARGECLSLSDDVLIAYAGAGPLNAEQAAKNLIVKGADRLISWGCAAALDGQLRPGQLVIPETVRLDQQSYETDKRWSHKLRCRLSQKLTVVGGGLLSTSRIVASRSEKQSLQRETSAVALDMESAAVAKIAQQANLPCLVLRAIADPAAMSLPQAVVVALDDQGQVQLGKLLRHLLLRPWQIPALISLGLHFAAARKTLKILAKQLNEIILL